MPSLRARSPRGFSLVEVLVAMVILAIGLSGITYGLIAASSLDRMFNSRAAAHAVAMDLVREIERWEFNDPRLTPVNGYAGADFAAPTVESFTVTSGAPSTVTEVLSAKPDHDESECGFCGRDLTATNSREPGRTYVFRRYWNVVIDPLNPHLKMVAVHVTYGQSQSRRAVATAFTSVLDREALARAALKGSL